MPADHPLTEDEFNLVKEGVMKSAPPNMDESTFNKWAAGQFPAALEQAETLKSASVRASIKDSLQKILTEGAPTVAAAVTDKALPMLKTAVEEFATNPAVPRVGSSIGRGIGAVTSLPASLSGFGSLHKGIWAGGRSGWFTAKLAQEAGLAVSKAMELANKLAPAVGALQAEGAVMSKFNSPEELAKLKKATGR